MPNKKLAISITLDLDLIAYVDAVADINGRSRSSMIAAMIRDWKKSDEQEKELDELFSEESEVKTWPQN